MNNTIYDIILADGTKISAYLNGNNYITDDKVDFDILSDENLSYITVGGEEYFNMTCTNIWTEKGQNRFIIREMNAMEKMRVELNAKIEFLAMVGGVDI